MTRASKKSANVAMNFIRCAAGIIRHCSKPTRTAAEIAREHHIPALVHVIEVTQPQGHSTSGSHERYKSPERLQLEEEYDCIRKMREWMIENRVISEPELVAVEKEDYAAVEGIRKLAWEAYLAPILEERGQVMDMLDEIAGSSSHASELTQIKERLAALPAPLRRDVHSAAHEALQSPARRSESIQAGLDPMEE